MPLRYIVIIAMAAYLVAGYWYYPQPATPSSYATSTGDRPGTSTHK